MRFEFHSSFLFPVEYEGEKAVLILLSTNCVVLEIPVIALCGTLVMLSEVSSIYQQYYLRLIIEYAIFCW
jgi:hypothetical protein